MIFAILLGTLPFPFHRHFTAVPFHALVVARKIKGTTTISPTSPRTGPSVRGNRQRRPRLVHQTAVSDRDEVNLVRDCGRTERQKARNAFQKGCCIPPVRPIGRLTDAHYRMSSYADIVSGICVRSCPAHPVAFLLRFWFVTGSS